MPGRRMSLLSMVLTAVLLTGLGIVGGCGRSKGPEMGDVEGTVTLNGDPLPNAQVSFEPVGTGSPSTAMTNEDGYYKLKYNINKDGAIVGEHIVRIRTGVPRLDEETDKEIKPEEKVPARYNANAEDNPAEMKKIVSSGSQTIDFDLTSDGEIVPYDEDGGAED